MDHFETGLANSFVFVFSLYKGMILFWKRFLAKRWVGEKSTLSLVFFFLKKTWEGRFGEGWRPTFLANSGTCPTGVYEYISWMNPPPPTRGFQLVANKDLGRDSRSYNFMPSWCFFSEPAFKRVGGDSSKVYHSQFSGCSTRPPGVWQTCDPEYMVWCNFLAHEAKQPSSTLARVVVVLDSWESPPLHKKYGLIYIRDYEKHTMNDLLIRPW